MSITHIDRNDAPVIGSRILTQESSDDDSNHDYENDYIPTVGKFYTDPSEESDSSQEDSYESTFVCDGGLCKAVADFNIEYLVDQTIYNKLILTKQYAEERKRGKIGEVFTIAGLKELIVNYDLKAKKSHKTKLSLVNDILEHV